MSAAESTAFEARALAAIERSVDTKLRLGRLVVPMVAQIAVVVQSALDAGGKLLICGNGGSAADAQHIAAELVGRYVQERPGLFAVALTTDTSALTAIANDYGYDEVFRRQVQALGRAGDVLIGISTSGNSPSVINALDEARRLGLHTVAFTGGRSSACEASADLALLVPATETARIQECHLLAGHIICELLDPPLQAPHSGRVHRDVTQSLRDLRDSWRDAGLRVVLTNGVFDLLHAGHLQGLRAARSLGDVLVVAVNGDESVRRLKGPDRPIVADEERAGLLAELRCVDHVVIFEEDSAASVIDALQPDVWCKGDEYAQRDINLIPEISSLKRYGGAVEFIAMTPGLSTTSVLAKIAHALSP